MTYSNLPYPIDSAYIPGINSANTIPADSNRDFLNPYTPIFPISSPTPAVQVTFPYSNNSAGNVVNPAYAFTLTTGTPPGTVTALANSLVQVATNASGASSASIISNRCVRPICAEGVTAVFTAVFSTPQTSTFQIVGFANDIVNATVQYPTTFPSGTYNFASGYVNNGMFFGYDGTSFGLFFYYQGVTSSGFVPQASWNVDRMNGTGPSGMTLNPLEGNVYKIQVQPSLAMMINFYVENSATGQFYLVHQSEFTLDPFLPSANNPNNMSFQLMAQASSTAAATSVNINISCMSGFVEGVTPSGNNNSIYSYSNSVTVVSPTTSIRNLINLLNNLFPPVVPLSSSAPGNQVRLVPNLVSIANASSSTSACTIYLLLNPTLASGSYNFASVSNNSVGVTDNGGNSPTFTATTTLKVVSILPGTSLWIDLSSYSISLNPLDQFLVGYTFAGGTGTISAYLSWKELW